MVKIKFIGTGSLEGIPSPKCDCKVCNLARKGSSKDRRFRSSIFIDFEDGNSLIVDCSPDFKHQVEKYKIPIDNILITHNHFDHFFGLGELSFLKPLYKVNPRIFGKKDVIKNCEKIFDFAGLDFEQIPENNFNLGKNRITLIPVEHAKNSTTSGLFFKNILILPEIYSIDKATLNNLKNKKIDLFICDGAYYEKAWYKDHYTIQQAIKLGKELGAKRIVITNIWHKTKSHDELSMEFEGDANISFDGLEIIL